MSDKRGIEEFSPDVESLKDLTSQVGAFASDMGILRKSVNRVRAVSTLGVIAVASIPTIILASNLLSSIYSPEEIKDLERTASDQGYLSASKVGDTVISDDPYKRRESGFFTVDEAALVQSLRSLSDENVKSRGFLEKLKSDQENAKGSLKAQDKDLNRIGSKWFVAIEKANSETGQRAPNAEKALRKLEARTEELKTSPNLASGLRNTGIAMMTLKSAFFQTYPSQLLEFHLTPFGKDDWKPAVKACITSAQNNQFLSLEVDTDSSTQNFKASFIACAQKFPELDSKRLEELLTSETGTFYSRLAIDGATMGLKRW